MLQKFFYIILVYCLYAVQANAQSHDTINNPTKKSKDFIKTQVKKTKAKSGFYDKNKIVRLNINIIDDSTNAPLNAAVTIVPVDTVNTFVPALAKAENNANLFYALLSRDKFYFLVINNSLYETYCVKLNIKNDSAAIIKLKRTTDTVKSNDEIKSIAKAQTSYKGNTFFKFIADHISLFVSLFLVLTGIVLYSIRLIKGNAKFKKEYAPGRDEISELKENLKTKDAMIDMLNNNLAVAESSLEQIKKEQPETLIAEQTKAPAATEATHNLICEIMMTAGPRKKFMSEPDADKDLGEDVCGFVSNATEVLLWVLDGTSDLHCLKNPADNHEYFSSRLLAQFFAEKLRKSFIEKQEKQFDEIVTRAIQEVKEDFLEQIDKLPDDEKFFLKKNIAGKNFPECATTILIARLALNGDFTAYRSGDSKMFLFRLSPEKEIITAETSLETKNDQSNDRLFFRLVLDANEKFDIFFNQLGREIVTEKNINTVICFSDGIGIDTEQLLKDDYQKNPQQIRKEIIYQLQGTGDDKSLCFIEIKEAK